jgi:hypothetical protein
VVQPRREHEFPLGLPNQMPFDRPFGGEPLPDDDVQPGQ